MKGKKETKVKAYLYDTKNGKGARIHFPLIHRPYMPHKYFEEKQPFDPISYLKSPFGIMVCVSGGLFFLMKKMPKPDKEMMNDMNQQMGGMPNLPGFLKG